MEIIDIGLQCANVSIEWQVCPALDWFSSKDKAWCESLHGWRYEWSAGGWRVIS